MRLLHPRTLEIAANRYDIPKTVISHVWSEIFKWKANGKPHPKMFIESDFDLGVYMFWVYSCSITKNCNLDSSKIKKLSAAIQSGWEASRLCKFVYITRNANEFINLKKNKDYLFSDACSLYYKGINIFPDIFGDEWRKYVPVESHKEILRQVTKTINK